MIERIHQYIIENNSTIFKTKTLKLEDFKKVYENAKEEDREHLNQVIRENGYLPYNDQQTFLFKVLLNIILNLDEKALEIMKKHEILPKQTKSKKQIPDQCVLDFVDNIKDKLDIYNVSVLRDVFNAEVVFDFYGETALKTLCVYLIEIHKEDILFELIKSNVGTVRFRKDLYADIHRTVYGELTMRELKSLKSKLSFLREKYEYSNGDSENDDE